MARCVQRPRVGVGDEDAVTTAPLDPRRPERRTRVSVIRVEQGELQVDVNAVRAEQGGFRVREAVLLARGRSITRRPEEAAR